MPLEDGEQVIVDAAIRGHRPYEKTVLTTLRALIEVSTRGHLRLTDRRLSLLCVRVSKPSIVYDIPRSLIRAAEPAGGGYVRLVCDEHDLPPEMTGIKAGLSAAEYGIAGGLAGAGWPAPPIGAAGAEDRPGRQGQRARGDPHPRAGETGFPWVLER